MEKYTENIGLYLEDDGTTTFMEWRDKISGPVDSNMVKIDNEFGKKQDKLTGTAGQVVGFDADGNPVPQSTDDLKGDPGLLYGTCSTASSTAAKVVVLNGFVLTAGAVVVVEFTNTNTASSPTLNVNGTGAKAIKKYGTSAPDTYMWQAGSVVEFVYDGAYWMMLNGATATTTYYGLTKLSNSVNSDSNIMAATPSAVKQAYDLAVSALPRSGGGISGMIDMHNNILTGLPSPTAPSDAVNYQTLINVVAGISNFALIIVSGVDSNGNTVKEKNAVALRSEGSFGTDTIMYVNTGLLDFHGKLQTITDVSVQLPSQFKFPSSDWSYIPYYSPAMRANIGDEYYNFIPKSSSSPLTYSMNINNGGIGARTAVSVTGYIKVGVNV